MSEADSEFRVVRPIVVTEAVLTSSSVTESEALWEAGTTYVTGNAVYRVINNVHNRFVSLQNGNTGKVPEEEDTWWEDTGPTNRWKMFDGSVQSQTSDSDEIEVELDITGRIDTVALLNVEARTARIIVEGSDEEVIYDEEYSLISTEGINNWAAYFRQPIERSDRLIVTDIWPYAGTTLTVRLEAEGETVKCGALVPGYSRIIGSTSAGARLGIIDYSIKEKNAFGDLRVLERAYSDTGEFRVLIRNTDLGAVKRLLTTYRATPVLYIGSNTLSATAVYGFYRSFDIEIAYPNHSLTTISLESVT